MSSRPLRRVFVSCVVPAFNEQARLPATIGTLVAYFERHVPTYELIVVDDGSSDGTRTVVRDLMKTHSCLTLIEAPHRGKGHAVRVGARASEGLYVIYCDADLPVAVEDIGRILDALVTSPVVIGSREAALSARVGEPPIRHLMGRVFNALVRMFVLSGLQDTQCGIKGFTADAARVLFGRQSLDGFGFDVELLYIARRFGYGVCEVPVTWCYRAFSRVDPKVDSLRMLRDILSVRLQDWRGRYRLDPDALPSVLQPAGKP